MIDALAMDTSEMKKELDSIGSLENYDLTKFKEDLLKMAFGENIVELVKGAAQNIKKKGGFRGKNIRDLTRDAGEGAFNTAVSDDKSCNEGQFVYVNGVKVCIPFKVTYEHDKFTEALRKLKYVKGCK